MAGKSRSARGGRGNAGRTHEGGAGAAAMDTTMRQEFGRKKSRKKRVKR